MQGKREQQVWYISNDETPSLPLSPEQNHTKDWESSRDRKLQTLCQTLILQLFKKKTWWIRNRQKNLIHSPPFFFFYSWFFFAFLPLTHPLSIELGHVQGWTANAFVPARLAKWMKFSFTFRSSTQPSESSLPGFQTWKRVSLLSWFDAAVVTIRLRLHTNTVPRCLTQVISQLVGWLPIIHGSILTQHESTYQRWLTPHIGHHLLCISFHFKPCRLLQKKKNIFSILWANSVQRPLNLFMEKITSRCVVAAELALWNDGRAPNFPSSSLKMATLPRPSRAFVSRGLWRLEVWGGFSDLATLLPCWASQFVQRRWAQMELKVSGIISNRHLFTVWQPLATLSKLHLRAEAPLPVTELHPDRKKMFAVITFCLVSTRDCAEQRDPFHLFLLSADNNLLFLQHLIRVLWCVLREECCQDAVMAKLSVLILVGKLNKRKADFNNQTSFRSLSEARLCSQVWIAASCSTFRKEY